MYRIFCVTIACLIGPAAAQDTSVQYRPEFGVYVQQGEFLRLEFVNFATETQSTHSWQGNFQYFADFGLKPVLRRNLREHPDVYRSRYLTMRVGYRYQTGLNKGNSSSGNIGIVELTPRYRLPGDLVITDRNRGEFRFLKGQAFDTRYRNRLTLERDIKRGRFVCTPYAHDEIFYDTRYDEVTPNRYAFGVQFPAGRHMVFDPYYMRQNGSHSNPPHLNTIGFTWNLYF